jgi:hypothetical protein
MHRVLTVVLTIRQPERPLEAAAPAARSARVPSLLVSPATLWVSRRLMSDDGKLAGEANGPADGVFVGHPPNRLVEADAEIVLDDGPGDQRVFFSLFSRATRTGHWARR